MSIGRISGAWRLRTFRRARSRGVDSVLTSRELDLILKRIERTPSTAPEFGHLVKILAKNFDDFPEKPVDGARGCGGLAVGHSYSGQKLFSNCRKGVSEFIGYTYKRDSIDASVPLSASAFVDPVDDRDLLDK